jgi:hypothetical protein
MNLDYFASMDQLRRGIAPGAVVEARAASARENEIDLASGAAMVMHGLCLMRDAATGLDDLALVAQLDVLLAGFELVDPGRSALAHVGEPF